MPILPWNLEFIFLIQYSSWFLSTTIQANTSNVQLSTSSTQEILVFGYAAKLFRDDGKALQVDQGKHLVPWMGQTDCLIDRCVKIIVSG